MNKRFLKCISACLLICLMMPMCVVNAADDSDFVAGKDGTFYARFWPAHENVEEFDNLVECARDSIISAERARNMSIEDEANKLKAELEGIPEGRRTYIIHHLDGMMKLPEARSSALWNDATKEFADRLDEFFTYYKLIGGPDIDCVAIDWEYLTKPWSLDSQGKKFYGFSTQREVFDALVNDPRYLTEVRPELEKLGFEFCTEPGENELKYALDNMYWHGASGTTIEDLRGGITENFHKLHAVLYNYFNYWVWEAYYPVIKKHYPNADFSNYESAVQPADITMPEPQGLYHKYSRGVKLGTISTLSQYGYNSSVGQQYENFMPGYPYAKWHSTTYNSFMQELRLFQRTAMYTQGNRAEAWVGPYDWSYHDRSYGSTDYWYELNFHMMMSTSSPAILFWDQKSSDVKYIKNFSDFLYELDEVLGFEDREILMERPTATDSKYVLSGMSAGGRNVWRITPDMCYSNFEIEDFLIDEENLIFNIGNQFVDFPEGSYIHTTDENMSMFGYWVISPLGTKPLEYRDETMPIAGVPDISVGAKGKEALQKKSADARARMENISPKEEQTGSKELDFLIQDDNMIVVNEKYESGEIKSYKNSSELNK